MQNLAGYHYLYSGSFLTKCNFANFMVVKKRLYKKFIKLPYKKDKVLRKIKQIIKEYEKINKIIDQKKAEELLLAKDFKRIYNTLKNIKIISPIKMLERDYIKAKKFIKRYKLINVFPEYYVVGNYPKPFKKMKWICAIFEEHEKNLYGIKPGIYFLKKNMYMYFMTIFLLHELVHAMITDNSHIKKYKHTIERGLEDGICDVFGWLFLGSKILKFNSDTFMNTIIHMRLPYTKRPSEFGELYKENMAQAFMLYKYFGVKGLIDIIKGGREKLIKVERLCLLGQYSKIKLKKGVWTKELDMLADYFLTMPRHLVLSPLALYVAEILREGDDIKELIKKNNLNEKQTKKALIELQERLFMINIYKGKITMDVTKPYLKAGVLRYESAK